MEHNHQYVFDKNVILRTDQKAPVFITQRPLVSAPSLVATSAVLLRDTSLGKVCCQPAFYQELSCRTASFPLHQKSLNVFIPTTSFPFQTTNLMKPREREREREGEREGERGGERGGEREREICDLTPQRLKNTILDGVPYAKDDLLAASHSTHSRRTSSTSVSRRHKIAYTTRQNQSGNIKQGPVSVWVSLLQKMISQRQSIRATPEEPQAPPLAEAQILPKQLDKPTLARPSKAHPLSGTSGKLQLVEAGPLDLYGCQSHQVPCRTKHK